ncbi:hypothetical protein AB0442_12335 [Kitasatospora sp. NPDC085895]
MAGYGRDKFPHRAAQGNSCDTREKVLARDGEKAALNRMLDTCTTEAPR